MSTPSGSNPAQEAFDLWRRTLDEGTQAWLRAMGQPISPPTPQAATLDFSQFWRPILTQGMEMWQKGVQSGAAPPDFTQQWKSFMDQWIEAWSKALGQAMATEGFAQALGRYLDQMLALQAPLRKGLDQQTESALKMLGLPSRGQVVSLAAQVVALEERIEGIEDRLDEVKQLLRRALASHDDADAGQHPATPRETPRRSRPREGT